MNGEICYEVSCNGVYFLILIWTREWEAPFCSGEYPLEVDCVYWRYGNMEHPYGTDGEVISACVDAAFSSLPTLPPPICEQWFLVKDRTTQAAIDGATVTVSKYDTGETVGTAISGENPDYPGYCLVSLRENTHYKVEASKSGVECLGAICQRDFQACTTYTIPLEMISPTEPGLFCTEPTTHYPSGCELLLAYDVQGNGEINAGGLAKAADDYLAGTIAMEEFAFIQQASVAENINAVCPACYSSVQCECTAAWRDAECVDQTHRRQVRTCVPPGCDIEEQVVDDPSCGDGEEEKKFPVVPALIVGGGIVAAAYILLKKN